MNPKLKRITSQLMIATLLGFTLPVQTAQAGMVGTQQLLPAPAQAERARLDAFLARDDVRRAMEAQGVSVAEARDRVAALSDAEVADLNARIDQLPAGGDSVLGILFAIFIILLVTDILGFTKVFPFTRSMR